MNTPTYRGVFVKNILVNNQSNFCNLSIACLIPNLACFILTLSIHRYRQFLCRIIQPFSIKPLGESISTSRGTLLPHRTLPSGLLNFSSKTGSSGELSCGMQTSTSLLIYTQDMRSNCLSICRVLMHGNSKVWSSARQRSNSPAVMQGLHRQRLEENWR